MRMLRLLATTLLLVVACVVVDSVVMNVTGGVRCFDPFLLLVVWHGAYGQRSDGMIVGALAGLAQDAASSVVFGTSFLSKVIVGYASMLAASRLIPGQLVTHAALLAGATILEVLVLGGVGLVLGQRFETRSLGQVALAVALNAALGTLVFAAVEHARKRRSPRGSRG